MNTQTKDTQTPVWPVCSPRVSHPTSQPSRQEVKFSKLAPPTPPSPPPQFPHTSSSHPLCKGRIVLLSSGSSIHLEIIKLFRLPLIVLVWNSLTIYLASWCDTGWWRWYLKKKTLKVPPMTTNDSVLVKIPRLMLVIILKRKLNQDLEPMFSCYVDAWWRFRS